MILSAITHRGFQRLAQAAEYMDPDDYIVWDEFYEINGNLDGLFYLGVPTSLVGELDLEQEAKEDYPSLRKYYQGDIWEVTISKADGVPIPGHKDLYQLVDDYEDALEAFEVFKDQYEG